ERYLNGAIGELEMSVQAARDQRIIVSILAIEQLTGVVTPRPVVIGSSGSASAGMTSEAILAYEDARKSLGVAEKSLALAQGNFDSANTGGVCKADPVADADKDECDRASDALTKAKRTHTEAAERYRVVSALALRGGAGASTVTSASFGEPSPQTQALMAQNVQAISKTVGKIVKMNADTDEFLFFCIRTFSDTEFLAGLTQVDPRHTIRNMCVRYVAAGIKKDAEVRFSADLFSAEMNRIHIVSNQDFETFWANVSTNGALDAGKFAAIRAGIPNVPSNDDARFLDQLSRSAARDQALTTFLDLTYKWQGYLAGRQEADE
ncbi:MAG TPA: hypothetical protein PKD99_03990, partial [Sphingopyxis sp.]|nr:hypothetical protein [Sphingopyxis sp.]